MIDEIGSEFFYSVILNESGILLPQAVKDFTYTFSGRTAIETVLKNELHIKKVMLPSYCCDSMIEPFRKQGIAICFYGVNYVDNLQIDLSIEEDIDAILWCNYFGYNLKMPDLSSFIKRGGIVIEDITHSFYSEKKYDKQSDYLIASIRKWEPILCGGYCASTKKKLSYKPFKLPSKEYLERKRHAMISKKEYLEGNILIDKDKFLDDFSKSNKWLAENYSGLLIDRESLHILDQVDYEGNVKKRRENAQELYRGLKQCVSLNPLFDEELMDCPLFVPVIANLGARNKIRDFLTTHAIYCPVHWPKPNSDCESNLYDIEISLVCDQRYSEADMMRIVKTIKEYEEINSK